MANAPKSGDKFAYLRELIDKDPDAPARSIAKQAVKDKPGWWNSLESCRANVRQILGLRGQKNRDKITDPAKRGFFRPPRTPGDWLDYLPPPVEQLKEWKPYQVSGIYRSLLLQDIHLPFHHNQSLSTALAYGKDYKPTLLLLNGDTIDHYWAGIKFVLDPRHRKFKRERNQALKFFDLLRNAFPDARMIFKMGNHEERYENFMRVKAPELLDVRPFRWESVFKLKSFGFEFVRDKVPIRLGKLNVIHGHEYRFAISNPVNPARGFFLRAKAHCLGGHFHQSSSHSEATIEGHVVTTFSTGCLCNLRPEYAPLNNWNHGFATVDTDEAGAFEVSNLRIFKGKVYR